MLFLVETFGPWRQLIDEIADVREDIAMGKVSVPVLYALSKANKPLIEKIGELWNQTKAYAIVSPQKVGSLSEEIKDLVEQHSGFDQAYQLADLWYNQAMRKLEKCTIHNSRSNEVVLLFRLKRAFLERLKVTNWNDIPGFY
jgi:geranylgeranyl pyrophosphate synthase